jgi:hypothetical protein
MNLDPHEAERADLDAAMRDYLARGGQVQRLAPGLCNWDALSNKAKINPTVVKRVRQPAQKRDPGHKVLADAPRVRAEPKPRVRKPKPRKERTRNGPPAHRPGTLQHEAWLALTTPMTARQLCDLKGWGMNTTMQRLTRLRERGLVVSTGSKGNMRWSAKCP